MSLPSLSSTGGIAELAGTLSPTPAPVPRDQPALEDTRTGRGLTGRALRSMKGSGAPHRSQVTATGNGLLRSACSFVLIKSLLSNNKPPSTC